MGCGEIVLCDCYVLAVGSRDYRGMAFWTVHRGVAYRPIGVGEMMATEREPCRCAQVALSLRGTPYLLDSIVDVAVCASDCPAHRLVCVLARLDWPAW